METVRNFKIFLVDDDEFNLNLTRHHLKQLGYTDIALYASGTECLNDLVLNPDVIFLDHHLDDITGFEVLKKVKRFNANTYVVMLSGQESMSTAIDSLKFGAFDYIIKDENTQTRITDAMARITAIQQAIDQSRPSIWRKIAAFI